MANNIDDDCCPEADRLFECSVCKDDLQNAHICPRCSKPFCRKCIDEWLDKDRSCPCCRQELTADKLVKARSFDQAQEVVSRMKAADGRNRCVVHKKEQLSLFCFPCEECICAGCLFADSHQEHKDQVVLVENAFSQYDRKLDDALQRIKEHRANIVLSHSKVLANKQLVTKWHAKVEKEREWLNSVAAEATALQNLTEKLRNDAKDATTLMSIMELSKKTEKLDTLLEPKAELIDVALKRDLKPEESTCEFSFVRFKEMCSKQDPYESLPLSMLGYTWRLKVFSQRMPLGDAVHIFSLRMEEGIPGEYSVALQSKPAQMLHFTLNEYVEIGIDPIENVNLEADTASVQLRIQLATTFAEKCRQMERYVEILERKLVAKERYVDHADEYHGTFICIVFMTGGRKLVRC